MAAKTSRVRDAARRTGASQKLRVKEAGILARLTRKGGRGSSASSGSPV
jgi:hypothetical protein